MSSHSSEGHIFLASPHMSTQGYERAFVQEAFDTNWVAPLGRNVDEFEKEIVAKTGAKAAAALTSGTAALHLALILAGVGAGDVVLCSTLTFSASANPIRYQGAVPFFIDSDRTTWNLSPDALKRAVERLETAGKAPKALILVHLYGMAADLDAILPLCRTHHILLIEDAAESLGTAYRGTCTHGRWKSTGTFGDYGVVSFNGNKIITSSGGGMLLLNTEDAREKAQRARFLATQAREAARHYEHKEIGYNYRMSNVVAGIGRGQLRVLEERVEQKRRIYRFYQERLGGLEGLSLMPLHDWEYSNCWLSCISLSPDCGVEPSDVMAALEADDIEARPVWKPMHLQPVFADCGYEDNGGAAQSLFEHGVCLPSDTKMTESDLERVCAAVRGAWG